MQLEDRSWTQTVLERAEIRCGASERKTRIRSGVDDVAAAHQLCERKVRQLTVRLPRQSQQRFVETHEIVRGNGYAKGEVIEADVAQRNVEVVGFHCAVVTDVVFHELIVPGHVSEIVSQRA